VSVTAARKLGRMNKQTYDRRTLEARLAARMTIDPLSGCHLWEGTCNRGGYGVISFYGKRHLVHRLAWTLKFGAIPEGLVLCHRCDERRCINPDHHFVDTQQANMADMATKRRARLERARADLAAGPQAEDSSKLTPIRIYVRNLEIVGKAVIRQFDPHGPPKPFRAARTPPGPRLARADSRTGSRYTDRRTHRGRAR
jgi:hypothetical protein